MKKLLMLCSLSLVLVGCGSANEPSISEIESGFKASFSRETGMPKSALSVKARKIGSGRWSICATGTRYDGQRRSLNATAVMDANGDIHYYTD